MTSTYSSTAAPAPKPSTEAMADAYASIILHLLEPMDEKVRARTLKRLSRLGPKFDRIAAEQRAEALTYVSYPLNVVPFRGPPMRERARERASYHHEWADRMEARAAATRYIYADLAEQYL